ncbi:MAG: hypothetical protein B6D46_10720 [Polyangiaceae bacterium UTPRO1]|jgi:radical SAM family uncharacterized protein/radical SAM-linked protein|nr:TIGR03960 family B12-binding radical SAM protein [Myxococcales bacterium]OQY66289.1 MAG: hypothetical protein B6D46_10720 [Polyangiaceae bacterium UTPRO1]
MGVDYEDLLSLVEKPGRYLGNERGAVRKDPDRVGLRFALAFPEVYEIAQSHLGLQILYDILNRRADVYCERVYAPWLDMEAQLRRHELPLASLETRTALDRFQIVGFSLQYELTYTNVLTMLELGRIPLLARDRGASHPLIIAGGPCAFNPEPIADFFDAIVLGDGEEAVHDIVDAYLSWRRQERCDLLARLARIDGVYVPSRFTPTYRSDGRIAAIVPEDAAVQVVRKRVVRDLDAVPLLARQVVPTMEIVHDRVALEVMRGCVKGCRFCQAGYIHRPLRERDPQALLTHIERLLADSGYEEVSLLSLSTGDYSCINPLLATLMDRVASRRIALSLPSTRVDALDPHLLNVIKRVRKTGFTLAPEAGTQRLRDIIQKEYREDELVQAADVIFRLGWQSLKLYFMLGLPTETEEDLHGIVTLARRVSAAGDHRHPVTVSASTFVPKPHTPFQWMPQIGIDETKARQTLLRSALGRHRLGFKWHDARLSYLEGVFSRGDRRLAAVLLTAHRLGCRFDGWSDQCRWDLWQRAFAETGTDADWYLRRRTLDETLPWDHLDSGVGKTFLRRELAAALARRLTPDCSIERCTHCGACDFTSVRNVTFHPRGAKGSESRGASVDAWATAAMPEAVPWPTRNWKRLVDGRQPVEATPDSLGGGGESRIGAPPPSPSYGLGEGQSQAWLGAERHGMEPVLDADARSAIRIRLVYQKLDRARFLGNRELTIAFMRASRRAGLPLAFSSGHHPLPRMSFGPALSLGFASYGEYMDLDLCALRSGREVMDALNRELPDGLVIVEAEAHGLDLPSVDRSLAAFTYSISLERLSAARLPDVTLRERLAAFAAAERFPLVKRIRGRDRPIDARASVTITRTGARTLRVQTAIARGGTLKPHHVVAAVLGLDDLETQLLSVTKIATVLAPPLSPADLPVRLASTVD